MSRFITGGGKVITLTANYGKGVLTKFCAKITTMELYEKVDLLPNPSGRQDNI